MAFRKEAFDILINYTRRFSVTISPAVISTTELIWAKARMNSQKNIKFGITIYGLCKIVKNNF